MTNLSRPALSVRSLRCNQLLVKALLVAASSLLALAQAPVYNVTPYALPTPTFSGQQGAFITSGPDGNLWFTDDNDYIGRITPAGVVTTFPLANTFSTFTLGPIIAGPDNASLWFITGNGTNESLPVIGKITTAGVPVVYSIPTPSGGAFPTPSGLAVGSDGNIWFTDSSNALIWSVTPNGQTFTPHQVPNPTYGIGKGPDGNIWFTSYNTQVATQTTYSGFISSITPTGTVQPYAFSQPTYSLLNNAASIGNPPDTVTTGPDGAIWFSGYNSTFIGRITTNDSSNTSPYTPANPFNNMAWGPDGALWFTQIIPASVAPNGQLGRITTAGVFSSYNITSTFTQPYGITAGPDGALWFTDSVATDVGRAVLKLTIPTATLPAATVGIAYPNTQLQSAGGVAPFTWSIAPESGALPQGLTLSNSGVISGTPNGTVGTASFSVQVTDGSGQTSTQALSIVVNTGAAATITATSGTPQSTVVGAAFAAPLVATVVDIGGNPVSGASVTFTAPATGASATFGTSGASVTVATGANGQASTPVSANGVAGGYTVAATVTGVTAPASFNLTNTAGPPTSIAAVSGGGQSAPPNTAFANPLVAVVKDAFGNLLPGVTVTFTAPASGASGTFSNNSNTATAVTTAAGTASLTFTANGTGGSYQVMATVNGVTGSANFNLTNSVGPPASITAVSGGGQSAPANTAFANSLVAIVKDANGNPVSGVSVTFTAPGSGASTTFGSTGVTVNTNPSGQASTSVTANGTAGTYAVIAVTSGVTGSASFTLTNTPGAASNITATSGSGQSTIAGSNFANALVATVTDGSNNPVSGVTVTFSVQSSGPAGATFPNGQTTTTAVTNASGQVATPVTANTKVGSYNVTAVISSSSAFATFALTNTVGAPANITATSGSGQSATVNKAFGNPFVATVTDANGNPVSGVTVTFAAVANSGASGTFLSATAQTNASGQATSSMFTANAKAGSYTVNATAGSVGPAVFNVTNTAGAPASITVTGGSPQSATVNSQFGSTLVATVFDANANPVSGVNVTFTAPGSGASGTFPGGATAGATTNSSGVAASPTFTANSKAGSYSVSATVAGVGSAATFALTNTAGAPATITVTGGGGQVTTVNTAFGTGLTVTVADANSNPVPNVSVTFTAPASGASAVFGGPITTTISTNASGLATSPTPTANGIAGNYTVTATVQGVSATSFSLTNLAGAPASITATSGTGQSAQVNTAFGSQLVVTVKDASGNVVSNANVVFSAPGSGASGTFASGGASVTIPTNSSGVATSPTFTANATAGSYTVTASVGSVGPAAFNLTNTSGAPGSITVTSGSGQSEVVNAPFGNPLVATVKDASGNAVPNVTVTFTAPASGASAKFPSGVTATAQTNTAGVATSPTFTANAIAGTYSITAMVAGAASAANFSESNAAGSPSSISATSGSGQNAQVKTVFSNPLVAVVKDASGNPVSNVSVTFTAPGSGASATFAGGGASTAVTTNSSGVATSPVLTANGNAGSYSVTAAVAGAGSATFSLTNISGAPGSITVTSGSGQEEVVNAPFGAPLVATVKDSSGNPVSGASVTFTAPSSGASAKFSGGAITATVTTNASGVATSPSFTANGTAGSYTITATVTGAAAPASFSLTNAPGAPALQITTTTLTNGTVGIAYTDTLAGSNGATPYKWSATGLPSGLALNSATGVISGTTTTAGTFTITVTLTDSTTPTAQTATATLSLLIQPPGTVSGTSTYTFKGLPTSPTPGTNITGGTVTVSPASSAAYAGTLSLSFAPNSATVGLPSGYNDATFTDSNTATDTIQFPALASSVNLPGIDPGTVAGAITLSLTVGTQTSTSTITIPASAPIIEAGSVQITNVTAGGFDVEFVATSPTREGTNATFTFSPATGATITGTTTFTVDVSSLLTPWFTSSNGLTYGGAFSITIPFTLTGSANAINLVSVTLANSVGTSAPVTGGQ